MTTQANSTAVPEFSFFSDFVRDSLRGSNSNASKTGYVAGGGGYTSAVRDIFMGKATWCKNPTQTVNYASCHDGYTLFDRLTLSMPGTSIEERVRVNNLTAAIIMTSQGTPFIQAGEELLRSKPLPEGGYEHNSYKSSDAINSIKWDVLNDDLYQDVSDYYAGLIAFRAAHPALRMHTAAEVEEHISMLPGLEFNVVACHITAGANGEENEIIAIFNPRANDTVVTLPEGEWEIYVNANDAGTEVLGTATGEVTVETVSAMVLVKARATSGSASIGIIGGADGPTAVFVTGGFSSAAIVGSLLILIAAAVLVLSRKRKK